MKYQIFNTKTTAFEGNHEIINPGVGDEFTLEKVRNANGQAELIRYKIVSIDGIMINVKEVSII